MAVVSKGKQKKKDFKSLCSCVCLSPICHLVFPVLCPPFLFRGVTVAFPSPCFSSTLLLQKQKQNLPRRPGDHSVSKGTSAKPDEFNLWDSHEWKGESTLNSCPPTATCVLVCVCTCIHTHTQINKENAVQSFHLGKSLRRLTLEAFLMTGNPSSHLSSYLPALHKRVM